MKMKYRNKLFRTAFIEAYLSCSEKNEREEIIREFNINKEFKETFSRIAYSFYIAHQFHLQNGLYMTNVLYLQKINSDNMDKIYPIYIYENLLIDLLVDYGAEGIQTFVTLGKLITFLEHYSSNKITSYPINCYET